MKFFVKSCVLLALGAPLLLVFALLDDEDRTSLADAAHAWLTW